MHAVDQRGGNRQSLLGLAGNRHPPTDFTMSAALPGSTPRASAVSRIRSRSLVRNTPSAAVTRTASSNPACRVWGSVRIFLIALSRLVRVTPVIEPWIRTRRSSSSKWLSHSASTSTRFFRTWAISPSWISPSAEAAHSITSMKASIWSSLRLSRSSEVRAVMGPEYRHDFGRNEKGGCLGLDPRANSA